MELFSLNDIDERYSGYVHTFVPMDAYQMGLVLKEDINSNTKRFPTRRSRRFRNTPNFTQFQVDLQNEIPFQYIEQLPEDSKSASYNDVSDIMGRFEGIGIYSNSEKKTYSINLIYFADITESRNNGKSPWTIEKIEMFKRRLQSLVYPNYTDSRFRPPPRVLLNIGNYLYRIPASVRSVTINEDEGPFTRDLISMKKKISLELSTEYPLWQAISQKQVASYSDRSNHKVLAYKDFSEGE